jgi:anoctamin-1
MIDFILVYKKDKFDKKNTGDINKKLIRKQFEENLTDEGLEFEHTKGTETGLKFVKVHAPWEVLLRYAEVMKLKMPMKQIETSWRLVFDDEDPYSKGKFTAPFTRDKIYLFHIPTQRDRFFTSSQRSQIVDFILKRKTYASNSSDAASFGINKLLQDGVYLACYPLHEGLSIEESRRERDTENAEGIVHEIVKAERNEDNNNNEYSEQHSKNDGHDKSHNNTHISPRMKLVRDWAALNNLFRKQPLDSIREYFGVKISLYFAWLGFYTSMLIPASVVGVICFFYGLITMKTDPVIKQVCSEQFDTTPMCPLCSIQCGFWNMSDSCAYAKISHLFDNPATVFFAVFMSVWATVYLEMWKRYAARITYRWDLSNFDKFEEYPRPEYLSKLSRGEKKRLNLITKMYEPYVPFWRKQLPHTLLSGSVVCFLVFVALISVLGVIVYRVALRTILSKSNDDHVKDMSTLITSSTAAGINLFCIVSFNMLYGRLAYYLTELEMPRTQTDFDNSLTLKMYLLQFVNYYSSIFYVAFFKGRFVNHPGDLLDDGSFAGRTQEECGEYFKFLFGTKDQEFISILFHYRNWRMSR